MEKLFKIKILKKLNFLDIAIATAVYYLIKLILNCVMKNKLSKKLIKDNKIEIIFSIILSIIKYIIYFITILLILRDVFNVNPALIVTATGVLGLAVGLGIQGLLRDFVSGLFILFENQFSIGDYVVLNNIKGRVIDFNIKNVKIIDNEGKINIVPNGQIRNIIKYPKKYEKVVFHLYYPKEFKKLNKVYSNLKENIKKQYNKIVKKLNELSRTQKIGEFNYTNFVIILKPFNEKIIDNIKEILQKSVPNIIVYTDKSAI